MTRAARTSGMPTPPPRVALLLWAVLAALPPAAHAGEPPSRASILMTACPSRASLRASLIAYADSILPAEPAIAGEAYFFAGQSYVRASLPDSAIACFERAVAARGEEEERFALADALLMRRGEGDIETVIALIESAPGQPTGGDPDPWTYRARLGWAELLAGETGRAHDLFLPLERVRDIGPVWGYRMARTCLEAGDPKRALAALMPLAIASREQDAEIMSLVGRAGQTFGDPRRVEDNIRRAIAAGDRLEGALTEALGGRRVRFKAEDDFALAGVVAPADKQLRRAAVVLRAPGDTLESYDSLTVALGQAGWAVMLMEMRGSGWSAAPSCPFPDSWLRREDAMQTVSAGDVRDAFRALALAARIDTTRYLVAGVGATAPIAVEAAAADPRVSALLLLSPAPAWVERGTMRERIRRLRRPIYFSNAPEDFREFYVTDAFYQAGDRPRSRVAEVKAGGSGARPFRRDSAALMRLVAWLEETMPARAPAKSRSR